MTGLSLSRFITENHLDDFARTDASIAQGVIVELIYRLVAASVLAPRDRRFPLPDSINQRGPDGSLDCDTGYPPFVPDGHSFWEIGVSLDARKKASDDYRDLTRTTPEEIRREASFVFVTPHSGRRDWPHTWATAGQLEWLERRKANREWKHLQILDGTKLVDWVWHFPAVERWLASRMGIVDPHTTTPDLYWAELRRTGEPPLLAPQLFLVGRDEARRKLKDALAMSSLQFRLETHSPQDVVDFVSAHIADLPDHEKAGGDHQSLLTIEWAYLGALDKHRGPGPAALERELSANPTFFCEVLKLAFPSEHKQGHASKEATERQRHVATNAYQLLRVWHRPPGMKDHAVDETELNAWLEEVFDLCKQSGHFSIAQVYIGQVLAHSPYGADGEWPVDSVVQVLDRLDVEQMRQGFTTELFNMRGVHIWDAGKGEQELAEKYLRQAEAIADRGFHRVATALRRLGDSYLEHAKREAAKEFDE